MPFSMLTLFRMGLFGAAHRLGSGQKGPLLPNICQTYPTMIKLAIVILYLKKIQKIYESHDRPLESAIFAISRNADIDCILILNL